VSRGGSLHGALHRRAVPQPASPSPTQPPSHAEPHHTTAGHWAAPRGKHRMVAVRASHGVLHASVVATWRTESST
jgi:hypothetical protein